MSEECGHASGDSSSTADSDAAKCEKRGGRKKIDSDSSSVVEPDDIECSMNDDGEHQGAPLPEDEEEWVEFLRKLNVLDSVGEEAFDVITRLLADIFKVPIALVSLVDTGRQWFKSVVGLNVTETPRDMSFCAHLFTSEDPSVLLVPDATLDPRFRKNPLVTGEPFIRFYCGAPIILRGHRLGSLCIIDREPRRTIGEREAMVLTNFADIVAGLIDKDRKQAAQYEMLEYPSFLIEVSSDTWPIKYTNALAKELLDLSLGDEAGFLDLFSLDSVPKDSLVSETRAQHGKFQGEQPCTCIFHPASRHGFGRNFQTKIIFPYSAPAKGDSSDMKEYNFVVIKWDQEGPASAPQQAESNGLECFPAPSKLSLIKSSDDFDAALKEDLCIVMYTSRFCAACVHFAEFYAMVSHVTKDVHFFVVSVDETRNLAHKNCTGAIFLPSVSFYNGGENVDTLVGGHCALFRQKVAALLCREGKPTPELPPEASSSSPTSSALVLPSDNIMTPSCTISRGEGSASLMSELSKRLEAERTYSRSLESMLAGTMIDELKDLRQSHEASLAKIALLQRDLKSRRRSSGCAMPNLPGILDEEGCMNCEDSDDSTDTERMGLPRERPSYHFNGTVANFLRPMLNRSKVLIYGGSRADALESGMRQLGIDASRQTRAARQSPIPTHGRRGRRLAIVDVIDVRTPQETFRWFEKVSDALPVGGVLATISVDFDILEVLGMLGEQHAWRITCTQGLKNDYGILSLEKTQDSDVMLNYCCNSASGSPRTSKR